MLAQSCKDRFKKFSHAQREHPFSCERLRRHRLFLAKCGDFVACSVWGKPVLGS